jgi:hypothetical protein
MVLGLIGRCFTDATALLLIREHEGNGSEVWSGGTFFELFPAGSPI